MFDVVHLTGFKKFGNHEFNPTQRVIEYFQAHPMKNVATARLDVTTSEVDKYINLTKEEIKKNEGKRVLNLHLGVGPNKVYYLEQCGYNNKDFGIPDNEGNVYHKAKICHDKELDQCIQCKIDLEAVLAKLQKKHTVVINKDPGRYLCNYIYFSSLYHLSGSKQEVCSLFIHFPTNDYKSHEQNVEFVKDLLQLVLNGK